MSTRDRGSVGVLEFSPDCEEWVEFGPAANRVRVGFHDYGAIYAVPGLYEAMFYETLGMRSTSEVVALYAKTARAAGIAFADQRVVDLGAGNGLGGEQLRALGVGSLIGLDVEPMAREAALRDRLDVYDDYLVADLVAPTALQLDTLKQFAPTAVLALSAVGIGHLPPRALDRALALLPTGGLFGFAVTPTLVANSKDDHGRASGFPAYLDALWKRADLLTEASYVHRKRPDGSDDLAIAFIGQIHSTGRND
ncbi:MAG: hypothetical protein ACR2IP_07970 [Solirubrobacteraceae bacterium]